MQMKECVAKKKNPEYKGPQHSHAKSLVSETEINENEFLSQAEASSESSINSPLIKPVNLADMEKYDLVLAICLNLMFSINYKVIFKFCLKDGPLQKGGSITGVLMKYALSTSESRGTARLSKYLDEFLCACVFKNRGIKGIFSSSIYFALISVVFKSEYDPENWKNSDKKASLQLTKNNTIKLERMKLFSAILENIDMFDENAQEELFKDLLSVSETKDFLDTCVKSRDDVVSALFSTIKYPKLKPLIKTTLGKAFGLMMAKSDIKDELDKIITYLNGDVMSRLEIVCEELENYLINDETYKKCIGLVYTSYIIEDCVIDEPNILRNPLLLKIMAKFLWLLDKLDLLYISIPSITFFEEKMMNNQDKMSSCTKAKGEFDLREGGFVRVILKVLSLLIKFDKTDNSAMLLRYFILREKNMKKFVKSLGEIKKQKNRVKAKSKYNALDITVKSDPKKMERHYLICESFNNNVIQVFFNKPTLPRDKSIFENYGYMGLFVVTCLAQLIHYEYYGISRYQEMPKVNSTKLKAMLENKAISPSIDCLRKLWLEMNKLIKDKAYFVTEQEKLNDCIKANPHLVSFSKSSITLTSTYSLLNEVYNDRNKNEIVYNDFIPPTSEEDNMNKLSYTNDSFINNLKYYLKNPQLIMTNESKSESSQDDSPSHSNSFIVYHLSVIFLDRLQPYLLLITSQPFFNIDKQIKEARMAHREERQDAGLVMLDVELSKKIKEKIDSISSLEKKEKHEQERDLDYFTEIEYKKFVKAQSSETEVWFNEESEKRNRKLFTYIYKKYKIMLKYCPLNTYLAKYKRLYNDCLGSFVKLSFSRDRLGRAKKIVSIPLGDIDGNKLDPDCTYYISYAYLRQFYLRKLLLSGFSSTTDKRTLHNKGYLASDFKFGLIRLLFKMLKTNLYSVQSKSMYRSFETDNKINQTSQSFGSSLKKSMGRSEITTEAGSELNIGGLDNHNLEDIKASEHVMSENYCEKNVFEVEMITIYGAIFGTLTINSRFIAFKSAESRVEKKFRFGSTLHSKYGKFVNKKWPLSSLVEVIEQRYNLLYQAVEFYFPENKSIMISFFQESLKGKFIKTLKENLEKRNLLVAIVNHFQRNIIVKEYTEKWLQLKISNFKYLTILNKYGGRSCNDIAQYPVFPWIIANYKVENLDFKNKDLFRPLNTSIGGISPSKREAADMKLEALKSETFLNIPPFQFGAHYLASRMVLGYLLRLEPFASYLLKFENGSDSSSRMFHTLKCQWDSCERDTTDNKELIPEFFYLPELFGNYNKYSFGLKFAEKNFNEIHSEALVRVDQVIMPLWARSNHHFIQANCFALESNMVSLALNQWIDLIFGEKQQDPKSYNLFKHLCDEENIEKEELTEGNLLEIREFGCNPIKLFKEKHASIDKGELENKIQHKIFLHKDMSTDYIYDIKIIEEIKLPIVHIRATEKSILVVTNDYVINFITEYKNKTQIKQSKDSNKQMNKRVSIPDMHRKNVIKDGVIDCYDNQRIMLMLKDEQYFVSCRYYDNSCKIFYRQKNTSKIELLHLRFHNQMVMSIVYMKGENLLFTGGQDGILVAWDLKGIGSNKYEVKWYACDHSKAIISLDCNRQLNLVVAGSNDNTISLRSATTGKFIRRIHLDYKIAIENVISHVRMSSKGYIVAIMCTTIESYNTNMILIFSINGEKIAEEKMHSKVNCICMDKDGYQFIIGGNNGLLLWFDLISLESQSLHTIMNGSTEDKAMSILASEHITTLTVIITNKGEQLLIGTLSGKLIACKRVKKEAK